MQDKLITVKQALEYTLKILKMTKIGRGHYEPAKQALAELNSYMQARDSEEMVEKVELAIIKLIDEEYTRCECANYKELAKAAIKTMEGNENDKKL